MFTAASYTIYFMRRDQYQGQVVASFKLPQIVINNLVEATADEYRATLSDARGPMS